MIHVAGEAETIVDRATGRPASVIQTCARCQRLILDREVVWEEREVVDSDGAPTGRTASYPTATRYQRGREFTLLLPGETRATIQERCQAGVTMHGVGQ